MEILFYLKEHLGKAILRSLLFVISLLSSQLVFGDTSCFPREGLTAEQIADQERSILRVMLDDLSRAMTSSLMPGEVRCSMSRMHRKNL